MKTVAIVLAAGSGSRMNTDVKKQYIDIGGKPVLYYSLKVFQDSFIDEIILVTAKEDMEYCKYEIVQKYGFGKVRCVVSGGKERYNSVMNGLRMIDSCDYVYIHDGARPFIDQEMLLRLQRNVEEFGTAVAAVSSKDTVKIVDDENFVISTPNRKTIWLIQTPQVFEYGILCEAYERMYSRLQNIEIEGLTITDDAMVVENFTNVNVKLVEGAYKNIKLTTPEDLLTADAFATNEEFLNATGTGEIVITDPYATGEIYT